MTAPSANFLSQTPASLTAYFAGLGERPYRVTQTMKWVYHRGATEFADMSDVSRRVREQLTRDFAIRLPEVVTAHVSLDGTRKWVVRVASGQCVECVLIPEKGRNTLCVSSQVGCMLDCSFCATGKQGFAGNLSVGDIVGQVLLVHRALLQDGDTRGVTNVVLMGMGEPLLNFDAVVAATSLMLEDLAFGLSKRRVTISTAGVVPAIYALAEVTDVSLAVSLHAPTNALRDVLVPLNRKYPISELLAACRHYQDTSLGERRTVTFEYTLLANVNDGVEQAAELARLLREIPCKINLIPFNPFTGSGYGRPTEARVRAFQTHLMQSGYATMLRTTRGGDIAAACGQLVGEFADHTRRRERFLARIAMHDVAAVAAPRASGPEPDLDAVATATHTAEPGRPGYTERPGCTQRGQAVAVEPG